MNDQEQTVLKEIIATFDATGQNLQKAIATNFIRQQSKILPADMAKIVSSLEDQGFIQVPGQKLGPVFLTEYGLEQRD